MRRRDKGPPDISSVGSNLGDQKENALKIFVLTDEKLDPLDNGMRLLKCIIKK